VPVNLSILAPVLGQLWIYLAVVVTILGLVVHVAFALAVASNARDLVRHRQLQFVSPVIWALATLFGGVWAAAVYWVLHHSTLVTEPQRRTE